MILILLTVFIMEDSIAPSLRLSALGSDFTFLIEDPLTDIQFNPAKLGNVERASVYFKPEWSSYLREGKINAAILYPMAFRNVCLGVLSGYGYAQYHSIYGSSNGYAHYDTVSYLESYPSLHAIVALPFIKEGGFFGLSGTIKKPNRETTRSHRRIDSDTSYYNSDTSFNHNIYTSLGQSTDNLSLWSIRSGFYLPFKKSAVGIIFSVTHAEPEMANWDSIFSDYSHMNIEYYDSIRTMGFSRNIDEGRSTYHDNYDIWQYRLGFDWIKDIEHGQIRLFCQGQLGKGDFDRQEIRERLDFYEYGYEYTSPDSSYSMNDTIIYEDTYEETMETGEVIIDEEEFGIGFEKLIYSNINFLIGLKINRTRSEIKETSPDTAQSIETNYRGIMPVGAEIFITPKFCLRNGVSVSYTNHSAEEIDVSNAEVTDSYIEVYHSFGLGFTLTPHLYFDLYSHGSDMASIDNWKLEAVYRF